MKSRDATDAITHADFLRGTDEGVRLAQACDPLPPLDGGPYAVGLLYGYRVIARSRAGEDRTSPPAPEQHQR